jgi:indole-3-glycerol phosphate synthase
VGRVTGVLGRIARERASAYAGADASAGADATAEAGVDAAAPQARIGRLRAALAGPGLALLAEVKRASPSQGAIAPLDPVTAARAYVAGGAAAISVLTEPHHFGGAREHLRDVARAITLPVLRKDFVVHPAQLIEARDDGAAGVLLIVALLGEALPGYLRAAQALGLDALVEVHDERELDAAMAAGADLIGVNNRDLRTLAIDLDTAPRLLGHGTRAGHAAVWVAESGYGDGAALEPLLGLADAVLVGTSLAASDDLAAATRRLLAAIAPPSAR